MGWGDWFCPHLSLGSSLRGCCHCSLGGLNPCETMPACLKGFTRCAGNSPPKRGMTQTAEDSNVHSSCIHGYLWLTTLKLFSFAQKPWSPSSPVSDLGENQALADQTLRMPSGREPREVPGTPSLSCRFQQTADSVQEAAAGEEDADALYASAAAATLRVSFPAANC